MSAQGSRGKSTRLCVSGLHSRGANAAVKPFDVGEISLKSRGRDDTGGGYIVFGFSVLSSFACETATLATWIPLDS